MEKGSVEALLRQALVAHDHERAELQGLLAEVSRLRCELEKFQTSGGCGAKDDGLTNSVPVGVSVVIPIDGIDQARPPPQQQQQQQHHHHQQLQLQQQVVQQAQPDVQPQRTSSNSEAPSKSSSVKSNKGARKTAFEALHEDSDDEMTPVQRLIDGPLEGLISSFILLNGLIVIVQAQYEGHMIGLHLEEVEDKFWPDLHLTFQVLEHVFNAIFILEIIIRLTMLRTKYFYDHGIAHYNCLDFLVVLLTSWNLYIADHFLDADIMNFSIVRIVRLFRLLRSLRFLDGVKILMPLRMLLNCIMASFSPLFWSIVLLVIVMLVASLILTQSLQGAMLDDEQVREETRKWAYRHYGTPVRAYYTVFEFTFSGGWPHYARKLVDEVSNLYALFFMTYIIAVVFTLFRIITAIFLKDTMALAAKDAELAIQQKIHAKEEFAQNLQSFFEATDTSGDGMISREEFDSILTNEKVKTWLSMLELSLHETSELFEIIAGDDGLVSYEEFTNGIMTMRGGARSEDVMAIKRQGQRLSSYVNASLDSLHVAISMRGKEIQAIQASISDLKYELSLPVRSL
mmetsp:Transcript_23510/g.59361  ORF Transcript_23510/g.59361 Transcript_23510/m.59361 type:complete len:570 (-) Transcript_23510:202-1911(-)